MIDIGECNYGTKCVYAHTLDEQNIDEKRRIVYNLIDGVEDLTDFDLRKNYYVYKSLLELTKLCKDCTEGACIGGYNCKSGACMKKYCVCIVDLNNGTCRNQNCDMIHLTKRGLKPYYNKRRPYYVDYSGNKRFIRQEVDDNSDTLDINDGDDGDKNEDESDDGFSQTRRLSEDALEKDDKYIITICERSIFG